MRAKHPGSDVVHAGVGRCTPNGCAGRERERERAPRMSRSALSVRAGYAVSSAAVMPPASSSIMSSPGARILERRVDLGALEHLGHLDDADA